MAATGSGEETLATSEDWRIGRRIVILNDNGQCNNWKSKLLFYSTLFFSTNLSY